MANKELRLQIEVDDNGSLIVKNFAEVIDDAGEESETAADKLKKIEQAINDIGKESKIAAGKIKNSGQSLDSLGKHADNTGKKVNKFQSILHNFHGKISSLLKSVFSLGAKILTMGNAVNIVGKGFNKLSHVLGWFRSKVKSISRSVFSLKGSLFSLAGVAGIGFIAKSFIHAASVTEQYRIRLKFLLRDVGAANQTFEDMADYASKVPHTYEQIMESATRLSGIMRGGSEEIKRWMPLIGDLSAAIGMPLQETTGQIIRMYSAGAASADMFRERGYTTMLGFKANVHYTAEETRRILMQSWTKVDSQFRGAADELGKTWVGLTSMMQDRWFQFRDKVMAAGLFVGLKRGVDELVKAIDVLEKEGQLDIWAKNMAQQTINSVKAVVYVFEGWLMLLHEIKAVYGWLKAETSHKIVEGLEKERERITKALDPNSLWRVLYPKSIETGMDQANRDRLDQIRKLIQGYKDVEAAARGMTAEELARIEEINARFERADELLDKITTGWKKTTDEVKKYNVAVAEATPFGDYIRNILQGQLLQPKISTLIKPDMLLDTDKFIRFLNKTQKNANADILRENELQLEKIQQQWDDFASNLADPFRDAFRDILREGKVSFEKLGDSILDIFADVAADIAKQRFIQPMIEEMLGKGQGFSGILGKPAFGGALGGQASWGGMLGAGVMGYAAGGGGAGGIGAGLGSMAGMYFDGPWGTMVGGLVGNYIGKMFEDEPDPPKIDLLYDVIDGQVELVAESWRNSPRSQELLNQIEETFQSQIDFYKDIKEILGGTLVDFSLSLSGKNQFGLMQGLTQSNVIGMTDLMLSGLGDIFTGFSDDWQKAWDLSLGMLTRTAFVNKFIDLSYEAPAMKGPGGISDAKFAEDILAEIKSTESIAALENWLSSTLGVMYTPSRGSAWYEEKWAPRLNVALSEFDELFDRYQERFAVVKTSLAQSIGNAFLEGLNSDGFRTFSRSLKTNVFELIKQGVSQGFVNSLVNQVFSSGMGGALATINEFAAGTSGVTLENVQSAVNESLVGMDETITKLEPIFNEFGNWLKQLNESLGLNTIAVGNNTDAIMGPVNSFLRSLDTGPLAASQSLAGLANIKEDLFTAALADPAQFSAYSRFMTSSWLPQMQGISADYAGIISDVRSGVENIPWVQQAQGAAPTAQSIGYEVGQTLGPMLLDLKESGQITINIIVDGEIIKQKIIESLDDPDVVQTIEAM